jgi:squalene-hopene/tetraprenyl-beta-curcumene cyclase
MVAVAAPLGFSADWNHQLAADYLDSRQKEWFLWPRAKVAGSACVSCHTGLPYLLARPALRRALGESRPTSYEERLLEGVQAQAEAGAVLSALVFALRDADNKTLSVEAERAFDRLWSSQIRDGNNRGAWEWPDFQRDPWATADSPFYGTTLAALAVGTASAEYQRRPQIGRQLHAMTEYLQREAPTQPLHNRLTLLWAASKLPVALPPEGRRLIMDEVLEKQQPDGGWTMESLGPWKRRTEAPPREGSNGYATAYVAFILQQAGVGPSDRGLPRALEWLRAHQDGRFGFWAAVSMNKRYEPDSMQVRFMQDAATAYAVLALLGK